MRILSLCGTAAFTAGVGLLVAGCSTASVAASDAATSSDMSTSSDAPKVPACAANPDDLISNFSIDMDAGLLGNGVVGDGKTGFWYTYGDKSGRGTLIPGEGATPMPDLTQGNPNCLDSMGTLGALHVKAMGFVDWGAATGADLMAKVLLDGGTAGKGTYDASKYRGISFWAKAAAPVKFVQVSLKDPYSDAPSVLPDQECVFDHTMPLKNCSPYLVKFGYGYTDPTVATDFPAYTNYKIDETWRQFNVFFADTKQDRFNAGQKPPGGGPDLAHLTGISIQANSDQSTMPPTANDFEIWIDDVMFIR